MKKLRITVDGQPYEVSVEVLEEEGASPAPVASASPARSAAVSAPTPAPKPAAPTPAAAGSGSVPSPLSGKVVSIDAPEGTEVKAGDKLLTLEAMKMNTVVSAPSDGTVKTVHVQPGDAVDEGQPLVTLG